MPHRDLDPNALGPDEDWEGNNIAVRCPVCQKVYVVSWLLHADPDGGKGYRECPGCQKSVGRVNGGRQTGGRAHIEW